MKLEYAITNLSKTLKYESQRKYLNEIITHINELHTLTLDNNSAFAKLFISQLIDKKTNDIDFNINTFDLNGMADIFKLPLDHYYKELTLVLNDNFTRQVFANNKVSDKLHFERTEQETNDMREQIRAMPTADKLQIASGYWNKDEIEERIDKTIVTVLNNYSR